MDRSSAFSIAAAVMALQDSKLDLDEEDRDRCGTIVGTGIGGIDSIHDVYVTLFDKGPNRVSPFAVPMMIANMVSGRVSIQLGLRGLLSRRLRLVHPARTLLVMHSASYPVATLTSCLPVVLKPLFLRLQ